MTCITIAQTKGGVSKTTLSIVLAWEFAREGYSTVILELDGNEPVRGWFDMVENKERKVLPDTLALADSPPAGEKLFQTMVRLQKDYEVLFVDLPGIASNEMLLSASLSDLVLLPTRAGRYDANCAMGAMNEITESAKHVGRDVVVRTLLTQTPAHAAVPRSYHELVRALDEYGLPRLGVEFQARDAWNRLTTYGEYPDPDSRAGRNARAIFRAVEDILAKDDVKTGEGAS